MDSYYSGEGASPLAGAGQGWRTTWNITSDSLGVVQDVLIVPPPAGASISNSAIYHTVQITNNGAAAVDIGWRNLYDWQVDDPGRDDGPNNSVENSSSGVVVAPTTYEFSHAPGAGDYVRVSIDPGTATYEPLLGIGFDPGFRSDLPTTTPDEYAYVSWPYSYGTVFDYTVVPTRNVTSDSAGLTWFGRDANSAVAIAAGSSVRFTQVLFGVIPDEPPPGGEVPEPASLAVWGLLGLGCLGACWYRRRRRSA
jgi:hypothetical protein